MRRAARVRSAGQQSCAAELGEDPREDPRDLHLGDADLLGDLRLGLLLEEAQVEDLLLALGQRPDRRASA